MRRRSLLLWVCLRWSGRETWSRREKNPHYKSSGPRGRRIGSLASFDRFDEGEKGVDIGRPRGAFRGAREARGIRVVAAREHGLDGERERRRIARGKKLSRPPGLDRIH